MGAYGEHADHLLERGYAPLPIVPGSKRPGYRVAGMWIGLSNWQRRLNSGPPPEAERRRWAASDAGVGVLGGYRGLVAVDIDTEDPAIRQAIDEVLPPSPVSKRGAKGETRFYHGPGVNSQSFKLVDGKVKPSLTSSPPADKRCCRRRQAVRVDRRRVARGPRARGAARAACRHRGADRRGAGAVRLARRAGTARGRQR